MNKTAIIIIGLILLIIAVFFLGRCTAIIPVGKVTKHTIDTIYIVKQLPPDTIITKATIIKHVPYYVYDDTDTNKIDSNKITTKIIDSAFIAQDSIVTKKKDTIISQYIHPDAFFRHFIRYSKDSIMVIKDSTVITITVPMKEAWYIKPAIGTACAALGILVGYLIGSAKK